MRGKICLVGLALFVVVAAGFAVANPECGSTAVVTGCVGGNDIVSECTQSFEAVYTVTAADVDASPGNIAKFCVRRTATSLCPNTSAIATVSRNGKGTQTVDLNADDVEVLTVNAKEGDQIQINVDLQDRNNGINCFRQGETQFEMVR